ncbi:MAG: hypothetical protein GVX96_03090 [Bacteroidetes bacterium]|jgi:hypothetical protein|nr:hypothetical protein [Bacteroidota bacterium]
MGNFDFKQVIKNVSLFRVSVKSILIQTKVYPFFICLFMFAFCLSSTLLSAQYSPIYRVKLDSAEVEQNIQRLSLHTQSLVPKMKRVEALFCRWEDAIEENTRIPFRFRLGTLDYVEKLEKRR